MKTLVIEPAEIVWHGLHRVLSEIGHTLTPANSVERAKEIFAAADRFDMVIIEPAGHYAQAAELIEVKGIEVPFFVFTSLPEDLYCERLLRAGAKGYVAKDASTRILLRSVEAMIGGEIAISKAMNAKLVTRAAGRPPEIAAADPITKLSARELDVFTRIGNGEPTRSIAVSLDLSPKTIETYRENIKGKLRLANGSELARAATVWVLQQAGAT